MGWKGTVRSLKAASRRAERESQKRKRELQRKEKEYAKMMEREQAEYEVDVWNNHIEVLQSVHKGCGKKINWDVMASMEAPEQPALCTQKSSLATQRLENYKPGFFTRLFKQEEKARNKLAIEIEKAADEERRQFAKEYVEWQQEYNSWENITDIASRILANEAKAKIDAIQQIDPFSDIDELGARINVEINDVTNRVQATLYVRGEHVIPKDVKSLLKSGKLSVKKMPVGKRNEILQDYICSCVLRVARELLNILPDDRIIVTAIDKLLNTATGHEEEQSILSVAINRQDLDKLNMHTIDPSDAMRNFVHEMNFKKTTGFAAVSKIN
ncbi:hypothetical protein CYR55_14265 [Chimaeribacter californicus]|uniref:Uncharacterized protein n=1 Tax=Chimaeribacter californicus TaxID=2060067 RepID=A0A2N5E2Z8_9GAMM|nr:hypothetical protein [Chimaeribacter californicus]PLR35061.1 hypothetical protein CYR55_14265 [Chimaeribacter californicus]